MVSFDFYLITLEQVKIVSFDFYLITQFMIMKGYIVPLSP